MSKWVAEVSRRRGWGGGGWGVESELELSGNKIFQFKCGDWFYYFYSTYIIN